MKVNRRQAATISHLVIQMVTFLSKRIRVLLPIRIPTVILYGAISICQEIQWCLFLSTFA